MAWFKKKKKGPVRRGVDRAGQQLKAATAHPGAKEVLRKTAQSVKQAASSQEEVMTSFLQSREWDREQGARMQKLAFMTLIALVLSLSLNGLQFYFKAEPRYFATTPDMRLTKLVSLTKPTMSKEALTNWVGEVVVRTLSIDFLHFRDQLSKVQENYSNAAFKQLVGSLKGSGTLEMIKGKRLSAIAGLGTPPVITASGELKGRMSWRMEFPVMVSYESSQGVENTQDLQATVLVQRVPVTEYPRGIKIVQLILK